MSAPGTWIDGVPAGTLPADDRGLHYGDGLFETLLVRGGKPRFLERHLARLFSGCERLAIPTAPLAALRAEIAEACEPAPALAVLKIIVTRGSAVRRGYAFEGTEAPRRMLTLWPAAPLGDLARGVSLILASGCIGEHPTLAGLKHLSRLENVLAAKEAETAGAFDALLRTADGRLVSGAMSNLFIVRGARVLTPPVNRVGVAGIMRGTVLRECAGLGIAALEQVLTLDDLHAADEVFITNARIGVVPVQRVGEHDVPMDPLARKLAAHIETLDA